MQAVITKQKAFFQSGATRPYAFRRKQLLNLKTMLETNEKRLMQALKDDLHKSSFEAYSTEIGILIHSINHTLDNLKAWMKTETVKRPLFLRFTKATIRKEPKGTILIIGPYNYPVQLLLEPLIGALAAGNTAILKPSEFTTNTEQTLKELITETFDETTVAVITGGVETAQKLLEYPFDHIFFTGSPRVGKIIYKKAAEHLTPVTLELGGKSPCIVDKSADLAITARRIVFGKFINAGQTCIAPDYLLVDKAIKSDLLEKLKLTIKDFYPEPKAELSRIVNEKHFDRIVDLIDNEKVVHGGSHDRKTRYIEPTILDDITHDDPIMQEEIFGPLLPIITYTDINQVIDTLKTKPRPLALYVFSEDKTFTNRVITNLTFGNGAINDTIFQVTNPYLPFGGTGLSGFGNYHGKASFDTFSHHKSLIDKSTRVDPPIAYPPYTKRKMTLIRRLLK